MWALGAALQRLVGARPDFPQHPVLLPYVLLGHGTEYMQQTLDPLKARICLNGVAHLIGQLDQATMICVEHFVADGIALAPGNRRHFQCWVFVRLRRSTRSTRSSRRSTRSRSESNRAVP